ncbi:TPA: hypothetical protein ACSP2Z_001640 [Aeromonas hydrophila]
MSSELRKRLMQAGASVPYEWDVVPLEALLKDAKSISVGVMYPGPHTPGGTPLIKVGDIKGGLITQKPEYCISSETDELHQRTRLHGDELLITLVGNPGECVVVEPYMAGWNPARAIAVIRLANPGLRIYLKAVLESAASKHLIDSVLNTTVQKTLNLKDIRQLPIPLPPEKVIQSLSDFSDVLSKRIALLRETNVTLEAIALALFKSWFVDVDPVHARARGEQPAGLAPEVAALFPDSFEESELGQVPMGWGAGLLNDLALLNPESWTVKNRPDSVAYVDLANAKENVIAEITEFLFEDAPSRARRVLRDGDTIVGTVRPGNRSYAFISNPRSNLTGSTGFAVLRPKQKAATEYVYLAATSNSSIEYLAHVADGGVRPEVVSNLPCVVPSYDVLNAFHAVAAPLFAKVAANHQQAHTLANLCDALLPRLISGQLRLPEAEQQLKDFAV